MPALPYRGVRHIYHVYGFLFVIAITGWPLPLVFGIKLAGLFEDLAVSVSVSSWFIRGAMNLAGPIQYLSKLDGPSLFALNGFFPLTGFGAAESGVNRCVMRSFIIVVTFVFAASWFAIAVSDFGSARIAGAIASTSEPAVFSRAKAGHQSGKG